MTLHRTLKSMLTAGSIVLLLSACSSAVFPEIIEEDNVTLEDVMANQGKAKPSKVLREGNSLVSDEKNASYEEDEHDIFAGVVDDEEEKVLAAKVKPVEKTKPIKKKKAEKVVKKQSETLDEKIISEQVTGDDNIPSVTYRVETVYFANGSSVVDVEYNSKIREAARLAKNNNAKIKVVGFASSRTRNTDIVSHKLANFKVSLERAQSVAAILRRAGIKDSDIIIEALSDTSPVYQEVMPEGERLNRRAEIYISY